MATPSSSPKKEAQKASNRVRDRAFRKRMAMKRDMEQLLEEKLKQSPEQQRVTAVCNQLDANIEDMCRKRDAIRAQIAGLMDQLNGLDHDNAPIVEQIRKEREAAWKAVRAMQDDNRNRVKQAFPDLEMNWHTVSGWKIPDDVKAKMQEAYDAELSRHV